MAATTPRPAAAQAKNATDAAAGASNETTERIRDLNERILEAGKKAGTVYLDAYEKALQSIADYQEQVARQTDVEWVSTIVDAQARFTRELTNLYVSTGRELLK
jgi:hypothetical protein